MKNLQLSYRSETAKTYGGMPEIGYGPEEREFGRAGLIGFTAKLIE